jgi:hypothetical protein
MSLIKYDCKHCTLEKSLFNISETIATATWEYPAYLSIPSPTFDYVNFGIEYDGENAYELVCNDEECTEGVSLPLRGDETETELKTLVLELFKNFHNTEGN